jgi:hypothetical protein
MARKHFLLLILITIVCCGFIAPFSYAQPFELSITKVFWGTSTEIIQAKPGDKNIQLNIVFQNTGETQLSEVTAFLYLYNTPFRDSATNGYIAVAGYPEQVKPGGSMTFTFNLNTLIYWRMQV